MANHHDSSHKRPLNEEFFSQEEGEFRSADAFQGAPNSAASRSSWLQLQPRRPRPFPSSTVLTTTTVVRDVDEAASAASSTKPTCPLIQEFLQSLGKTHLLNDIAMKRGRGGKEGDGDGDDGDDEENGTSSTKPVNLHLQQQGNGQTSSLATNGTLVSKITAGQHRRFLQLSGDHDTLTATAPRTPQTNKEYRRLKSLVKAEQQLYAQYLHQFWLSHVDRLLVGFGRVPGGSTSSSGSFVQLAMKNVTIEQWLHRKLPLQYGRCRQVISLRPTSKSTAGSSSTEASSRKLKERNTILDSLQREIVFQTDEESTLRKWVQNLPPEGSVIGNPVSTTKNDTVDNDATNSSSSIVVPIQADERAFELARKHGATMVTTFQTLLVLLTTCISSKAPATSWVIPVSRGVGCKAFHQEGIDPSRKIKILDKSSDLIILESPTQLSFSSTREWMTAGLDEALSQCLEEKASTSSKKQGTGNGSNQSSPSAPCNTYTLLTLPSPARNKPCRVLVRQHDRFFCTSGKCPLRVHAHLEYFPEHGQREIPSIFDKAVWMLDYVLQPLCRVVVAKVDPACGRILEWDEASLAHALTLPSSLPRPLLPVYDEDVNSSIDHLWQQLDHLLTMAIPTIGQGQHVLCYPARFGTTMKHDPGRQPRHHSISVHQPHNSLIGGNEEVLVDMSVEIPLARAMNDEQLKCLLETDAVRRCYRPWQWETTAENVESQIPYTFPVAVIQSKAATGAVRHKA